MTFHAHEFETPIGRMITVVDEDAAVRLLEFANGRSPSAHVARFGPEVRWTANACAHVVAAVDQWFAGDRKALDSLELRPAGTAFSKQVWSEVRKVPFGSTASYGDIAARLGRPGASRAVGRANGANPVCLAIPCHRIVGADGSLTGYGGGLATKAALLAFESRHHRLGHT